MLRVIRWGEKVEDPDTVKVKKQGLIGTKQKL